MEQRDIDFINDMNDVIICIDMLLSRDELSDEHYQRLNNIKRTILDEITRVQLLELIKNSKRLQEIINAINTNKDELKKDLNDLKSICEKIVTAGITADIFANFFQICTKVASYVP